MGGVEEVGVEVEAGMVGEDIIGNGGIAGSSSSARRTHSNLEAFVLFCFGGRGVFGLTDYMAYAMAIPFP